MLDGDLHQILGFQINAAGLGHGTFDHVRLEQDGIGISAPLQNDSLFLFTDSTFQVFEQPIAVSAKLNPAYIGHGLS